MSDALLSNTSLLNSSGNSDGAYVINAPVGRGETRYYSLNETVKSIIVLNAIFKNISSYGGGVYVASLCCDSTPLFLNRDDTSSLHFNVAYIMTSNINDISSVGDSSIAIRNNSDGRLYIYSSDSGRNLFLDILCLPYRLEKVIGGSNV